MPLSGLATFSHNRAGASNDQPADPLSLEGRNDEQVHNAQVFGEYIHTWDNTSVTGFGIAPYAAHHRFVRPRVHIPATQPSPATMSRKGATSVLRLRFVYYV
jgi:hypothetical protein